jgi:membrane protease YdiL (CAAX protease family)
MVDKINEKNILLKIIAILIAIQGIRIILTQLSFLVIYKSIYNHDIISITLMVLFIIAILLISNSKKISLSILPNLQGLKQKIGYIVFSIIVFILIITTPIFTGGFILDIIIPLVYATVVIPIFEELIFRGYVWNKLKSCYKNEITVYIINTILFALWHLGYVDVIWFKTTLMGFDENIAFVMLMKVIIGLCFGIILGFARYKFKNCYITMLLHSFMNIFGR